MDRFARYASARGQPATATLGVFDSPIGTSANNVACLVGVASTTIVGALLVLTVLPGAPRLPTFTFIPFFILMFPLAFWATFIQQTLIGWERQKAGLPKRRPIRPLPRFPTSPFEGLPVGFVRVPDKLAMGLGVVVGFVGVATTSTNSTTPPNRPFLAIAFAFSMLATVTALAEHRRRKLLGLKGVLGWPVPPTRAPRLARSRPLIVWLLLAGVSLAGLGGTVAAVRSNDYQYREARLVSNGTATVPLPGGDDVIFVGNLGETAPSPFEPSQVTIIALRTGRQVTAQWDPSADHNSPDGIPSLGLISFTAPWSGAYRITIHGPPGLQLFVARSPGAEARLLAGWLVLLAVGLVLVLAGAICLVVRISWRYRVVRLQGRGPPGTIEEWMAQPESR